jgi:hypothetical protein
MTIEEQIKEAQRNAEQSAQWADAAADEAAGAELIGLNERAERCRDQSARHEEDAAVFSATARQLRERYPVESLSAEGQKSLKRRQFDDEEQAQTIDQERNEALGLAPDQAPPERSMGRPSPELAS